MKKHTTLTAALVLTVILGSSGLANTVQAQRSGPGGDRPAIEQPEGWEEMTEDEQQAYREANRPEGAGEARGQRGNFEQPEGWDEMTDEEKKAYMEANRPEGAGEGQGQRGNFEQPEGWEEMTDEEKKAYMEANRPEGSDEAVGTRGNQQSERVSSENNSANKYAKKALKAKNYKKFTGNLESKKVFTDDSEIENKTAVTFLQQRGILDGYADGSFGAKNSINRAESLKVLLEALGESAGDANSSDFSDVQTGAWYTGYVNKAKELGIVSGYEDGTFQPGKTVNQVELLKIAFESFGIDLSDYEVTSSSIDENAWYGSYLQYAIDNELLDADDIDLGNGMDREGFSELVYRLIQQQESL